MKPQLAKIVPIILTSLLFIGREKDTFDSDKVNVELLLVRFHTSVMHPQCCPKYII